MVAMAAHANPPPAQAPDDPADVAALADHAAALITALDATVAGWVQRVVAERWRSWRGEDLPAELLVAARQAGEDARAEVVPALRVLLATDVEQQRTNPLSVLRAAVRHPTAVLAAAGMPEVQRDAQAERFFPDDVYDLSPAAFADIDPSVHEPGLRWGAAKAHVVLRRHRPRT